MPYIGLLASRCLASSTDAELPQQRRRSIRLHQCCSKNCAELLTSKEARSSHSNLDLRLIVENRVQQRAMDCNAAVVIDEAQLAELVHEKTDAGARPSCQHQLMYSCSGKSMHFHSGVDTTLHGGARGW